MSNLTEGHEVWSVRQTAGKLQISERTLYAITAPTGTLKAIRIGCRVGYRPETVREWIAAQEQTAVSKPKKKRKNDRNLDFFDDNEECFYCPEQQGERKVSYETGH